MRTTAVCLSLIFLCSCGGNNGNTNVTPPVIITNVMSVAAENAGRSASNWSLTQVDKLNHTVAVGCAGVLKNGSQTAVGYLRSDAAQQTAEAVNTYLLQCLLKNINPVVASAIDTAAAILDDVLQVPAGTLLSKAELELLASFAKGVGEGAQDFLDGKLSTTEPKFKASTRPRQWIHLPGLQAKKPRAETRFSPVDQVPLPEVLGVTCQSGAQPGYTTYFGWIPGSVLSGR